MGVERVYSNKEHSFHKDNITVWVNNFGLLSSNIKKIHIKANLIQPMQIVMICKIHSQDVQQGM